MIESDRSGIRPGGEEPTTVASGSAKPGALVHRVRTRVLAASVMVLYLVGFGFGPGLAQLSAQTVPEAWPRFEAGLSGALFVDYPSEDAEPYCEQRSRGIAGHAGWWFSRWIGLKGALVLTGGTADPNECLIAAPPSMAPIPFDEPFSRNRYEAGSFSGTMVSSDLGLIVEPMRGADVSPRALLGVGRMLGHDEGFWYLGGGFRFGFGRHALTIDTEWWNFDVEMRNETVVYRRSGAVDILDSTVFSSGLSMFLLELGWAVDLR